MKKITIILASLAIAHAHECVTINGKSFNIVELRDSNGTALSVREHFEADPLATIESCMTPQKSQQVTRLKRRSTKRNDDWMCLPLVSTSPLANVYHHVLTGQKNVEERTGGGIPIRLGANWYCSTSASEYSSEGCKFSTARNTQIALSNTLTVSTGDSQSHTMGTGSSTGSSSDSSTSKNIQKSIDDSITKMTSDEKHGSLSDSISKQLTKGYDSSQSQSQTIGKDKQITDGTNWDTTLMKGWSHDKSLDLSSTISIDERVGRTTEHRMDITKGRHVDYTSEIHADHTDHREKTVGSHTDYTDETFSDTNWQRSKEESKNWNEDFTENKDTDIGINSQKTWSHSNHEGTTTDQHESTTNTASKQNDLGWSDRAGDRRDVPSVNVQNVEGAPGRFAFNKRKRSLTEVASVHYNKLVKRAEVAAAIFGTFVQAGMGIAKEVAGQEQVGASQSKTGGSSKSETYSYDNSHGGNSGDTRNDRSGNSTSKGKGGSSGKTKSHGGSSGNRDSRTRGVSKSRTSGSSDTQGWSLGVTRGTSEQVSKGISQGTSHDITRGKSNTRTQGVRDGISGSNTQSKGGSKSVTIGHSDSDTKETRTGDSLSYAYTDTKGKDNGWSNSKSDTYGQSIGEQSGYTTSDSKSRQSGHESSTQDGTSKNTEISLSTSSTVTLSITDSMEWLIPAGACRYAACIPLVKSVAVPWKCRKDGKETWETSEIQKPELIDGQIQCTYALVNCYDKPDAFTVHDSDYHLKLQVPNTIRGGRLVDTVSAIENEILRSANGKYTLQFIESKDSDMRTNLVIKAIYADKPLWQTGITKVGSDEGEDVQTRFRISSNGVLMQEVKGLYKDHDEWTTAWATLPNHLIGNQVGMYGNDDYALTLTDKGILVLRDANYVEIWTSDSSNPHHLGYKYPINYPYPAIYETEANEVGQVDLHNSKSPFTIDPISSLSSRDLSVGCGERIEQGGGLTSSNDRFTLYLSFKGSLILKDGYRTMWSTDTSDTSVASPNAKYHLMLTQFGELLIRDHRNRMIWSSVNKDSKAGSYTTRITDEGQLVVENSDEEVIWNQRGEALWFTSPMAYIDDSPECNEVVPYSDPSPLVNHGTGKCLGLHGPEDCITPHLWQWDEVSLLYRSTLDSSLCLGSSTTGITVGACNPNRSWIHNEDGLMTLFNSPLMCLHEDGMTRTCDNPRLNKLWKFGTASLNMLQFPGKNILQPGEILQDDKSKASLKILSNGDLEMITSKGLKRIQRNGMPRNFNHWLELSGDGTIRIRNVRTSKVLVDNKKKPGPFTLTFVPVQNMVKLLFKDSTKQAHTFVML